MSTPWTFPVAAPADDRYELPTFTVMPNWKNGVTETLEWMTEILSSEIAVEQRRSLRRFPRRRFEASFMRAGSDRARLDLFLAGTGKGKCLVPLWHERFELGEVYADGNPYGVIQFKEDTLKMREFHPGELVLITNGDASKYAVLFVNATDTDIDQIQLTSVQDVGEWPAGSHIYPLRTARVMDQAKLSMPGDRVGITQIRFQLTDADDTFTGKWGPVSRLWYFKPNRIENIEVDYFRSDFTLDFDTGVFNVLDPSGQAQVVEGFALRFFGRESFFKFRQFLYMARGKLHPFRVPSYTADIIPIDSDLGGLQFNAERNGYFEYLKGPQEARKFIAFEFKDNRPTMYRTITNVEPLLRSVPPFDQVGEKFSVNIEIPPILKREIARISYMVYSRFDQDAIEIQHHTPGYNAVSTKVVMRAMVGYVPDDFDRFATSWTYPVELLENIDIAASIASGELINEAFNHVETAQDSMGHEAILHEGELRDVLIRYRVEPFEAYTLDAVIAVANMYSALKSYDQWAPEGLDLGVILNSGTMLVKLIVYTNWTPEGMDTSAVLASGTLT